MTALKRGVIKNCSTAKYYENLNLSLQTQINAFQSTAEENTKENEDMRIR